MAFKQINDFTFTMKAKWITLENRINQEQDKEKRMTMRTKQSAIRDCMVDYYTTVLLIPKFKTQRIYMQQAIEEIEPAFAQGFFGTKTIKK